MGEAFLRKRGGRQAAQALEAFGFFPGRRGRRGFFLMHAMRNRDGRDRGTSISIFLRKGRGTCGEGGG